MLSRGQKRTPITARTANRSIARPPRPTARTNPPSTRPASAERLRATISTTSSRSRTAIGLASRLLPAEAQAICKSFHSIKIAAKDARRQVAADERSNLDEGVQPQERLRRD